MPIDTTLSELASGYRLRKKHEKSRNGCLGCKQQRKKCDELRPSCSRCTRRLYTCRYPQRPSTSESETDYPRIEVSESELPSTHSNDRLSDPIPRSRTNTEKDRSDSNALSPSPLNATELSLLSHYLTHTSQTIPFDPLDLHALAVGVPNLAFQCKAVMSSLLSLAAACKCHDIAHEQNQKPLDTQKITEIQELLALAERHHRASLHHIQATMQSSESYDNVLANAALMVLYASASHSIRVHLAAMAKQYGQQLPIELLPQHSQWISFTRAAHTASTAVLNDIVAGAISAGINTQPEFPATMPSISGNGILSPEDGPSAKTKRLFLPLVASTYDRALGSLRRRAERTADLLLRHSSASCSSTDRRRIHASLETISVLENCTCAALSARGSREGKAPWVSQCTSILGSSAAVSPWVAQYMISVTSMESPQILRRIIMSFLNQAPTEFLELVQSVLDSPATDTRVEKVRARNSSALSLSPIHVLVMDIFAHWLVLVMLLDGVWWIRNIGQWELSQVILLMKTHNVLGQLTDIGGMWWPESMYLAKRQLTPDFMP
ncbi:hypothetical protein BO94DRAFT_571423 [Aspergillus sclerotioniger CBS 115572]|uniref:Zn(2)-C6 fungal-type domain-containing protein n=1 Tax=Aspergillus sclerotioniger CBS 115572 TaxID=1450535 RepID=A0A317XFM9_9EURO|nr:hypothetical protein BO94DRAFT_571423 [Aspergillus sclerotioniger CBS 115572]PWY95918.1 hypothetical protein BO94DRAFT_571423 [Aspergillus sclerotioniger CBS 115572]